MPVAPPVTAAPVALPAASPVAVPVAPPVTAAPVALPAASPVAVPVAPPVTAAPVALPAASPVAVPVAPPVTAAPVASPDAGGVIVPVLSDAGSAFTDTLSPSDACTVCAGIIPADIINVMAVIIHLTCFVDDFFLLIYDSLQFIARCSYKNRASPLQKILSAKIRL